MKGSSMAGTGVSRAVKWVCVKCKTENKGHVHECRSCGHEPVLGRRDQSDPFTGRAYTPPEHEE